jgi:hypothetical protein
LDENLVIDERNAFGGSGFRESATSERGQHRAGRVL